MVFVLQGRGIHRSIIIYRLLSIPNIYFNIDRDYQGYKSSDYFYNLLDKDIGSAKAFPLKGTIGN